ncbi:DUF1152 domain-containing protein [Pendulispora brunnea]|uniref:DUF1152 domain-containing protein n=1 Tax=Pendulispora brunnea TaxID=2905690 RepID=A0ABZ2K5T3_9BACT
MNLLELPFLTRLRRAQRILISGAGGGFDVFAGLPLYFALRNLEKEVVLSNLSFTYLGGTNAEFLTPALAKVTALTQGETHYFPERYLCQWFASRGEAPSMYCFEKVGVAPLREAYAHIVAKHAIDAIVLVDGGTDILMRGDEAGLGTPEEDMTSLAAVAGLQVPHRIVTCLGFGIDAFHGVCHAQFLENVAALDTVGGYLGAHTLLLGMPEAQLFRDALDFVHARMPERPSIVNTSILSALEGHFGDHHRTRRTRTSKLFINPLMALYWHFDLQAVAERSLYLPSLEGTQTVFEVSAFIEAFRRGVVLRPRSNIPV